MLQYLTNKKSTLVQVMAWCHQATINYLSQCWPRPMSSYGVTWSGMNLNEMIWHNFYLLISNISIQGKIHSGQKLIFHGAYFCCLWPNPLCLTLRSKSPLNHNTITHKSTKSGKDMLNGKAVIAWIPNTTWCLGPADRKIKYTISIYKGYHYHYICKQKEHESF